MGSATAPASRRASASSGRARRASRQALCTASSRPTRAPPGPITLATASFGPSTTEPVRRSGVDEGVQVRRLARTTRCRGMPGKWAAANGIPWCSSASATASRVRSAPTASAFTHTAPGDHVDQLRHRVVDVTQQPELLALGLDGPPRWCRACGRAPAGPRAARGCGLPRSTPPVGRATVSARGWPPRCRARTAPGRRLWQRYVAFPNVGRPSVAAHPRWSACR